MALRDRVKSACESGLSASRFVEVLQATVAEWSAEIIRETFTVLLGLGFNSSQSGADLLGFNDANSLQSEEQEVICESMSRLHGILSHSHSLARLKVNRLEVLNEPACFCKLCVDIDAGFCFRVHASPYKP